MPPVAKQSAKPIKRDAFYFNPKLGRKSETKKSDDYVFFASKLEFKTYRLLESSGIDFIYQPKLSLLGATESFTEKRKEWDFKLLGAQTILECKGQWINTKAHKDKKALFLLEVQCAERQGYRVHVVGDLGPASNRKPFKIGPVNVKHYEDFIHGIRSTF